MSRVELSPSRRPTLLLSILGLTLLLLNSIQLVSSSVIINLSLSSQLPLIGHPNQPYSWAFKQDSFQQQPQQQSSTLTYSVTGLPDWCTFNPETLTFSGTPTSNDVGRSDITVTSTQSAVPNARVGARELGGGLDSKGKGILDELEVDELAGMGKGMVRKHREGNHALGRRADGDSTSDDFQLIVLNQPAPALNKPLDQQLPVAASLGKDSILPNGALHIPYGWSFSIGFAGDTFSSPDGSTIFYSTILGDGQPIPDWLIWSSDTFTMYGVAPTDLGQEGGELEVIITASNREDFSGTSSSFSIVLGERHLTLDGGLRKANATVGETFRYKIPTTGLQYDGRQVDQTSNLSISSNLDEKSNSNLQWLTFDPSTNYISGTPPLDLVRKDQDKTSVSFPLTFRDASTQTQVAGSLDVDVYASAFTSSTLSNIFVEPGRPFNTSLASFLRHPNSTSSTINPIYDPPNATDWLTFNQTSYLLSGRPPMEPENDRVKVQLQATPTDQSRGNLTSTAHFYIALKDDKNPGGEDSNGTSSGGSNGSNPNNSGGLSQRGKVALAASLGTAGGLIALILLMVICRRCCAAEEHDTQGRPYDASPALSDDRTLYDGAAGGWKKAKASPNPSTLVGSPYLDPSSAEKGGEAWSSSNKNQGGLERVSLSNDYQNQNERNGDGSSPVIEDAYNAYRKAEEMSNQNLSGSVSQQEGFKPRQMGVFGALALSFGAGKKADEKKAKRSLAQNAAVKNAHNYGSSGSGLGLTGLGIGDENAMSGSPSDNPYSNAPPHSRSRHSIRTIGRPSSAASWESDIWQNPEAEEDRDGARTPDSQSSFKSVEVPRKRGGGSTNKQKKLKAPTTSPMRHRNSHINQSPAFNAPAAFETQSSDGEGRNANQDLEEDPAIIQQAHHVDVRTYNDAQNTASKRGSVSTHHAVFSEQAQRNVSQHLDPLDADDAFEDAEDEYGMPMSRSKSSQKSGKGKRSSYAAERMSGTSAIIYGDNPIHLNDNIPDFSPHQANSILGGASYNSAMNPEDTMRPIQSNQAAPPTPQIGSSSRSHQRGQSYSKNSQIQYCQARIGEYVRIVPTLNPPPPMRGGAPGSPGKRSGGKKVTYVPVLDTGDSVSSKDWPAWMEWLQWNDRGMYELSGEVPQGKFPPGESRVPIAIMARKDASDNYPTSPTPGSPGKPSHRRINSFDSAATTAYGSGGETTDEYAARLELIIVIPETDEEGYQIGAGEGGGLGPSVF